MPKPKSESGRDTPAASVGVTEVENIVQKAVAAAIDVVRTEFNKLFQDVDARLQSVEERLEIVEHRESSQTTADFSAELSQLSAELETARKAARDAMVAANDAEQYNRRNNIRIRGLPIQQNEDCRLKVIELFQHSLELDVDVNEIDAAHQLPVRRKPSASTAAAQQSSNRGVTKPVVIVRFKSRDVRDTVIRCRKKLKDTNTSIVEDLTALNVKLLNRLRNDESIQQVWSWNGRVTALTTTGTKIQVKPFQTVQDCLSMLK